MAQHGPGRKCRRHGPARADGGAPRFGQSVAARQQTAVERKSGQARQIGPERQPGFIRGPVVKSSVPQQGVHQVRTHGPETGGGGQAEQQGPAQGRAQLPGKGRKIPFRRKAAQSGQAGHAQTDAHQAQRQFQQAERDMERAKAEKRLAELNRQNKKGEESA